MSQWWGRYIGLPFGEGPGQVTCWGLVVAIYRDRLGIDLPAYGEVSARDLVRIARAMEAGKDDGWRSVAVPGALDVCLMRAPRGGSLVCHVGVMIDAARVLHVEEAAAAAVVPVGHYSIAGRVLGFRRLAT